MRRTTFPRLRALVLALALLCSLTLPASAEDPVPPTPTPTPAPAVSGVAISSPSDAPLDVGKTMALSATVNYSDNTADGTVTWTSASPSIAFAFGTRAASTA